jgi:hypothetical protein
MSRRFFFLRLHQRGTHQATRPADVPSDLGPTAVFLGPREGSHPSAIATECIRHAISSAASAALFPPCVSMQRQCHDEHGTGERTFCAATIRARDTRGSREASAADQQGRMRRLQGSMGKARDLRGRQLHLQDQRRGQSLPRRLGVRGHVRRCRRRQIRDRRAGASATRLLYGPLLGLRCDVRLLPIDRQRHARQGSRRGRRSGASAVRRLILPQRPSGPLRLAFPLNRP